MNQYRGAIYSVDAALAFLALAMMLHLYSHFGQEIAIGAAGNAIMLSMNARAIAVSDYLVSAGGAQKGGGELEYQKSARANVIDEQELAAAVEKLRGRGLDVEAKMVVQGSNVVEENGFASSVACANRIVMCANGKICRLQVCVK